MKKPIWAAFLLAGSATVALADVGAGLVGNTVTVTDAEGAVTRIYYPSASAIEVKTPDGTVKTGTWRVEDTRICTQQGDAPESCTAPIKEPPVVGSTGTLDADKGALHWAVSAGKGF